MTKSETPGGNLNLSTLTENIGNQCRNLIMFTATDSPFTGTFIHE